MTQRTDVAIILINQCVSNYSSAFATKLPVLLQIANDIRQAIRDYTKMIPTVLEIPSKDQPYDPDQDTIMKRVNMVLGAQS